MKSFIIFFCTIFLLLSCTKRNSSDSYYQSEQFWHDINSIDAHDERDTIVGNFTGLGIDTLYVKKVDKTGEESGLSFSYNMVSTNPEIPSIELFGIPEAPPKLVLEGDLDQNGTCEVGYLHTWNCSQWRFYRIFTLVDGEWRYLVFGDYLDTPEWFRHSGVEVAEPGIEKGTLLIHHYSEEYIEKQGIWDYRIVDTIVSPTFSCVEDIENQNIEEDLYRTLLDDSEIIGEWCHIYNNDSSIAVLYYYENNPYMAFIEDSIIVDNTMMREFESYDGYRAFEPSEIIYGERATAYYRIIGDRLLERPIDGSGADYWFEPIKYYAHE